MASKTDLRWRKSSYSGEKGQCVECAAIGGVEWRKSTYSGESGSCVEVATGHGAVAVRDSKYPDGPMLTFTACAFSSLLALARDVEAPHVRG